MLFRALSTTIKSSGESRLPNGFQRTLLGSGACGTVPSERKG